MAKKRAAPKDDVTDEAPPSRPVPFTPSAAAVGNKTVKLKVGRVANVGGNIHSQLPGQTISVPSGEAERMVAADQCELLA